MLQNNSLSSLPSSLLSPLDSLLLLNLSSNALTHSTLGIIVNMIIYIKNKIMTIINIIMSSNSLTHPTTEPALRGQVKLIALDVSHNKLDKVQT